MHDQSNSHYKSQKISFTGSYTIIWLLLHTTIKLMYLKSKEYIEGEVIIHSVTGTGNDT